MNGLPLFSSADMPAVILGARRPGAEGFFAMYSSVYGGIVTDPAWMLVPADDHVVHRGDGVFETLKCADGFLYALDLHLDRLFRSASGIGLVPTLTRKELADVVAQTLRAGGRRTALVRLLLSRGPGSYGVSPADCPAPQVYCTAYTCPPSFMRAHPEGARVVTSRIPLKPGFLANLKTCNYLPNALMKKEAVDAGAHFALAFDERGFLAEGATENFAIVDRSGVLLLPRPDRILDGVTLQRVEALAGAQVARGNFAGVRRQDLTRGDVEQADELLILGTTPDVTSVVEWDGRSVGGGRPGPVAARLGAWLEADIQANTSLRTRVFAD